MSEFDPRWGQHFSNNSELPIKSELSGEWGVVRLKDIKPLYFIFGWPFTKKFRDVEGDNDDILTCIFISKAQKM